ncbi:hypothetical protein [Microbacterium sp. 77mftsu3.1]|uniref:hypothetical protein n=1 Tax=Microbacterium sp. 77mftsu3.1 TaxID=1761802 RepID=UPI00037F9D1C|nr:hypothetical protein [Microbacterium sp. 77mftsu3.1]SDH39102.1 hypothetical protein SAMN04488590_3214 [Microbacterium sp. 77mftsu3.1]
MTTTPLDLGVEAARIGAVHRLAFAREQHPDLVRAEAQARVDLAAAIMKLDEAADSDDVIWGRRHTMQEQAAVERAKNAYAQALADLLRGEAYVEPVLRMHSRDPEHLQEDLAAALTSAFVYVFGRSGPPEGARNTATGIIDSLNSHDQSQDVFHQVRTKLGTAMFGAVALHCIRTQSSLAGQAETLTTVRSLKEIGLTVDDLGWPNNELHPAYQR